jgi:hypothetical protein
MSAERRSIYKYDLPEAGHVTIAMPKGAHVLCVQMQGAIPRIWALVDPEQPKEDRRFIAIPTGLGFNIEGCTYVGTYQINRGEFIFHLFEEPRR